MLDPKLLRTDLDAVKEALARRGFELDITTIQTVEASRKALQTKTIQAASYYALALPGWVCLL